MLLVFRSFLFVLAGWFVAAGRLDAGVVINEIHFEPAEKRPLEFVELHNAAATDAHLGGWQLGKFRFGAATSLPPGGFLIVATDPADRKSVV